MNRFASRPSAGSWIAGWILLVVCSLGMASPSHAEKTLEGGAHIWVGSTWGEFRAHVGPRYAWGNFSVHPHGALGMAFLTGVSDTPATIGAYSDFDYAFELKDNKAIMLGVGGGGGHIFGLGPVHGYVLPQGYGQLVYRWGGNLVGLMGIWGPNYSVPDEGFPVGFPAEMNFSGVGFRFEYVIDVYPD